MWGMLRAHYNIPKTIFYLLKRDYGFGVEGLGIQSLGSEGLRLRA